MADGKNVQLSDELLMGATGGFTAPEQQISSFDAIGVVVMHLGGRQYQVRFDDGAELIATNQSDEIVADGTGVGLFAVAGGWTMQALGKK